MRAQKIKQQAQKESIKMEKEKERTNMGRESYGQTKEEQIKKQMK
jgi:hypothetical protein